MSGIILEEILIILIAVILTAITLKILAIRWGKYSQFFYSHPAYFTIAFVIIYSIEQALFMMLSVVTSSDNNGSFILTGLFALVVLTTATIQGVMMEARNKKLSSDLTKAIQESAEKLSKVKSKYESTISSMREDIYYLIDKTRRLNK